MTDFQSEWAENGLELMAKDMRTQPTPPNLDIWISGFLSKQWVDASPVRTSVWCSPAGGFFLEKKQVPGVFAT